MSEPERPSLARHLAIAPTLFPGLAVAAIVAAAASFVAGAYGGPVMLLALLMGMSVNFLSESGPAVAGLRFTSRTVLRIGVALLGLRIAVPDVLALGLQTVELLILGVVVTVAASIGIARLVGSGARLGTLIGGATAICGASAALAIASVLPSRPEGERDTVFAVVSVTTLSTLAMILYPAIFRALGFDDAATGVLIGATIHDVAQVVGAGYAVSDPAGDTATVVKLFRVALLLPLVFAVSLAFARFRRGDERRNVPVPFFAVAFAALVLVNSAGILPEPVREALVGLSRWCLVAAVAAIGVSTSLRDILKVGYGPVAVAVGGTSVLLLFSVAWVALTR